MNSEICSSVSTLELIDFYTDDCQKKVNALKLKRDRSIKRELDRYAKLNAKYKVGDILRHKYFNKYMMVEKIVGNKTYRFVAEPKQHNENYIQISYYGKGYKKVNNEYVRTVDNDVRIVSEEEYAVLIKTL